MINIMKLTAQIHSRFKRQLFRATREIEKVKIMKKDCKAKEFFGIFLDWKRPTDEIKQKMKKG